MYPLKEKDLIEICFKLKKRIIKVLYLKENMDEKIITKYDFISYIDTLVLDMYGYYISTENVKFYNSLSELEGIKKYYENAIFRKKVLDLANFVEKIN